MGLGHRMWHSYLVAICHLPPDDHSMYAQPPLLLVLILTTLAICPRHLFHSGNDILRMKLDNPLCPQKVVGALVWGWTRVWEHSNRSLRPVDHVMYAQTAWLLDLILAQARFSDTSFKMGMTFWDRSRTIDYVSSDLQLCMVLCQDVTAALQCCQSEIPADHVTNAQPALLLLLSLIIANLSFLMGMPKAEAGPSIVPESDWRLCMDLGQDVTALKWQSETPADHGMWYALNCSHFGSA